MPHFMTSHPSAKRTPVLKAEVAWARTCATFTSNRAQLSTAVATAGRASPPHAATARLAISPQSGDTPAVVEGEIWGQSSSQPEMRPVVARADGVPRAWGTYIASQSYRTLTTAALLCVHHLTFQIPKHTLVPQGAGHIGPGGR
jgi:hypothetical protein